jgi:hypothetical protein
VSLATPGYDRKTGTLRALLAHNDCAGLSYAGAVFVPLNGDERAHFFAELERLATSWVAFKSSRLMDVKWCCPMLVVELKHLAGSKTLRHATVRGSCEAMTSRSPGTVGRGFADGSGGTPYRPKRGGDTLLRDSAYLAY